MKNKKDLLNEVQEALAMNTAFKNCRSNICVLVNDGAAIVVGAVENKQLKNLARKIGSAVPGVNLLMEDLKIEATPQHRVGVQIDWASGRIALTQ